MRDQHGQEHPLRDKARSEAISRAAESVLREYRCVRAYRAEASASDATAHANLYAEVADNLDAAVKSAETAARLMDPDLTDAADYEGELT